MLLIPFLGLSFQLKAQGDLLVTPTRVVFEGNAQKEELNIVNKGRDTAVYSISFLQYRMKEDGSFETIDKPDSGQMFADPYLRIFPRKVTLAPEEPQVIALQLRKKPDMLPGEYRSHIYFRAEKKVNPLGLGKTANDTTTLKVELTPIFGVSIPVLIHTGAVSSTASLSDLKLKTEQDTNQFINFVLHREGNISLYGDFTIQFIPTDGKAYDVGKVKGVAVYTNITKRNVSIKLNKVPGKSFKNGKLRLQYVSPDTAKSAVYAEAELSL